MLEELHCLSSVTKTIVEGNDPNLSVLLGIRDLDFSAAKDGVSTNPRTFEERRDLIEKQTSEIQAIRSDISGIRASLSEKYAENLGDDMNNCTTQ